MRPRSIVPLIALLVAGACGGGSSPPPGPAPMAPFPAPVRLYYDNTGGIADSVRMVIRDAQEFDRVWRQATSQQSVRPTPPAIDFTNEMVLVVGAGRMTPEDRIAVDSVGVSETMNAAGAMVETLSVIVETTLACQRFDIPAFPLEIVRLRRFDGDIRFVERTQQAQNCRDGPEPLL